MLCIFPVHEGDAFALLNLLKWIKQLGGCPGHSCLIVADAALPWHYAENIMFAANESFEYPQFITNGQTVPGWIAGSNSLWATAAKYCAAHEIDGWLWMEPDAVPLKSCWLDALKGAYEDTASDFLAGTYVGNLPSVPARMMTGIAVYSANAITFFKDVAEAFDVQLSRTAIDYVQSTNLIQQLWGQPGLPPTFRNTKTGAPRHALTLDNLDPDAVIFHRNKDGTLIELLRAKAGLPAPTRLLVVLPVCHKDAELMIKCLDWVTELDGQNQFDCLISHDPTLGPNWMNRLRPAAQRAFRAVHEFTYPRPVREVHPDAANIAFQSTAQHIQTTFKQPWLWLEADCVPLKSNWLPTLWQEYQFCGFPVMGPVVAGRGHLNGTSIYPPDFPNLAPRAFIVAVGQAWDTEMTPDLVGHTHNCARSFFHAWGIVNGNLHPAGGPSPHFSSMQSVDQWLPADAVLYHRCKDGSLIDQLRAKKRAS